MEAAVENQAFLPSRPSEAGLAFFLLIHSAPLYYYGKHNGPAKKVWSNYLLIYLVDLAPKKTVPPGAYSTYEVWHSLFLSTIVSWSAAYTKRGSAFTIAAADDAHM